MPRGRSSRSRPGTSVLLANAQGGDITVRATVDGIEHSLHFTCLQPTTVAFVKAGNVTGNGPPAMDYLRVGCRPVVRILPENVNFSGIVFWEGYADSIADGFCLTHHLEPHTANGPHSGTWDPTHKSKLSVTDVLVAVAGPADEWEDGSKGWPVPWEYSPVEDQGACYSVTTVNQAALLECFPSSTRLVLEKGAGGGASVCAYATYLDQSQSTVSDWCD